MNNMSSSTLFIGAGNMGSALLEAGINAKVLLPETTYVIDSHPEKMEILRNKLGVQCGNPGNCKTIFLAVKPQSLATVFPVKTASGALLISVLAGTSSATLAQYSGISRICRVMPNTPALINKGVSGIFFSPSLTEKNKEFCRSIFSACGKVVEVNNENDIHAITAISGSGPAYFYQFTQDLILAGEKMGLSREVAKIIAEETCIGSGALLDTSEESAKQLQKKVTSPGGTTQAAIQTFKNMNLQQIVERAAYSAFKRSKELGTE